MAQEVEAAKRAGRSIEQVLNYPKEYRLRMNRILSKYLKQQDDHILDTLKDERVEVKVY
ncbi:hypothetical protein D3C76_1280240 [compost metagenome]